MPPPANRNPQEPGTIRNRVGPYRVLDIDDVQSGTDALPGVRSHHHEPIRNAFGEGGEPGSGDNQPWTRPDWMERRRRPPRPAQRAGKASPAQLPPGKPSS